MVLLRLVISLAGLLACAEKAEGRVFSTPALAQESAGVLVCRAANDAEVPLQVRVQAFDLAGVETLDTGLFSLAPGGVVLSSGGVAARTCRFSAADDARGLHVTGQLVRRGAWRFLEARPLTSENATD